MRRACLTTCMLLLGTAVTAQGQENASAQRDETTTQPASVTPAPTLSPGERAARLRRAIDENEARLKELTGELNAPTNEYSEAQSAFDDLDEKLAAAKDQLSRAQESGDAARAQQLQETLKDLQQRWSLAKERLDLASQERKARKEQVASLKGRIARLRQLVAQTTSSTAAGRPAEASTRPSVTASAPAASPTATPGATPQPQTPQSQEPSATSTIKSLLTGAPTTTGGSPAPAARQTTTAPSPEVVAAKKEAKAKSVKAKEAEQHAERLGQWAGQIEKSLSLERELLKTARAKVENERKTVNTLSSQLQQQETEGAPRPKIEALRVDLDRARDRLDKARDAVTEHVNRIDDLQSQRAELQSRHIAALREAERAREEAAKAKENVAAVENPFSLHNLYKWLLDHGPKVAGIFIGTFVLLWLVKVFDKRLVRLIAGRSDHGSRADRENRAQTLVGVFNNVAHIVIIAGAILMILTEIKVNIVPLMGGVAVVGLAVAFGAQSLIKDFFSGFMILVENQFGVNDVVVIGNTGGLVEKITLRITVLRDLEGKAHFIPNGQITTVSNLTHGWSRVVFDIGVSYNEDVDQVISVLTKLASELCQDPQYKNLVLGDPEMLGVDSFGDSAVVIKFLIKTKPLQQWTIQRAMLYRIKKKFDELGIEIPFPHRTVYHRVDEDKVPVFEVRNARSTEAQ